MTAPFLKKDEARQGTQHPNQITDVVIILTDIQLHTTTVTNPATFARGIQKAITNGKPGRTYMNQDKDAQVTLAEFKEAIIPLTGLDQVISAAQAKGKRVRFFIPRSGIPYLLGKDSIETAEALKRKQGL